MTWPVLAGAAVVALLAIAGTVRALLRRRKARIGSPEEAAEAVDAALSGFTTAGAVVGADGTAALAVDGEGRVAVCKRAGSGLAVREVAWTAIRATAEGMLIESGERRFGRVVVAGVDALDVRRLAPHLTRG